MRGAARATVMWARIKDFFYTVPFPGILVASCLAIGLLAIKRLRRLGVIWIACAAAAFAVLSLPWTASHLVDGVRDGYGPWLPVGRIPRPISIVLLDGDHAPSRIHEAIRLYRAIDPTWVVLSGWTKGGYDEVLAAVPRERIVFESGSTTTYEQIANLGPVLAQHGIDRFVLVTSALHARRVAATLKAAGLQPTISAADLPAHWQGRALAVPRAGALRLSQEALYEYAAIVFYKLAGRL